MTESGHARSLLHWVKATDNLCNCLCRVVQHPLAHTDSQAGQGYLLRRQGVPARLAAEAGDLAGTLGFAPCLVWLSLDRDPALPCS